MDSSQGNLIRSQIPQQNSHSSGGNNLLLGDSIIYKDYSQECTIYFIIPKLLSGKKHYVTVLLRKMRLCRRNKKFRQNCSDMVSKCAARSYKENEHPHLMISFTNSGVIGILMRRNMCFSAAIVIERLVDSTRTRINAAHVIVGIIAR